MVCQVWNRMRDPGRRHRPPGVQLHPAQVRRRRPLVLRGGHLQPDAVRGHGGGVGGGPPGGLGALSDSPAARAGDRRRPGSTALRCRRGSTTTGKDRAPLVGGHPRRRRLLGLGPGDHRGGLSDAAGRRGQPPRRGPPVRPGPAAAGSADPRRPGPALRGLQDAPPQRRRGAGPARGVAPAAPAATTSTSTSSTRSPTSTSSRPGPGPSRPSWPPGTRGCADGWASPVTTSTRAGRPPRGAAALRPRHGDVPGQPAAVVGCRLPAGRRGPAGPRRRARRGRDGHQGGGGPALGRPAADLGAPGTSRTPTAGGGVPGRRLRPVHPRGPRRLHARATPDVLAHRPRGRRRGLPPMDGAEREEAVASVADEPSIFPMPAA